MAATPPGRAKCSPSATTKTVPTRPVLVTAGNATHRLTVEDAERLADELDEALAWSGRPLQPRGWWSPAGARRADSGE
jgi:hypothetical protein